MRMRSLSGSWSRAAVLTGIGAAVVVATYAVLAYHRRWIGDDGLIVVRTVRQILEGNGPVYNAFERAEPNTSTLWTWVVALAALISRQSVNIAAVATGWLLAVGGLALAIDGTRRWHRARGSTEVLVPASAWVFIGTVAYWDFATSGLETGLCIFWIAACWWLLVTLEPRFSRALATIVVFGLGPLVRPDFAVVTIVFCVGGWIIARPTLRQTVILVAAGAALPVAYEVFRAGYYGTLVPLPALAKSATAAKWERGLNYVIDFYRPYRLWLPFFALVPVAVIAARRIAFASRDRVLISTIVVSALLLATFVVRVGGDFMHGRFLLAPTLLLLLPALVLPLRRWSAPTVAIILVWTVFIAVKRAQVPNANRRLVNDERWGYVTWTRESHPIEDRVFIAADGIAAQFAYTAMLQGRRVLVSEGGIEVPMNPALKVPLVFVAGRLGTGGAIAPIDGIVVDTLGLANPLGARITPTNLDGFIGHEKPLPWEWIHAEYTSPEHYGVDGTPISGILAARKAVQCGELKELLESVRAPLTFGRFWSNLTGAIRRTRLVIPVDPYEAEFKFCGTRTRPSLFQTIASTSVEDNAWSADHLVDGKRTSETGSKGFSSEVGAPQWIEIRFTRVTRFSKVILYPRTEPTVGVGFPIDFSIQVWDGVRWIDRVQQTGYPRPAGPQTFTWGTEDVTNRIRISATKLADDGDGARLQLAEVEVE